MPGQFPDFDLYEELEVSPRASEEVIQAAYRRLAQTFHPDHYKGPDSGRMTRLNVAREFLSDSLKRADYDRQRPGAQAEAQARAQSDTLHQPPGGGTFQTYPPSAKTPRAVEAPALLLARAVFRALWPR